MRNRQLRVLPQGLEEGLSAAKIAERIGLSKPAVLARLHDLGIRRARSGHDPDNYQHPANPPFGNRVVDGKLVLDRREMTVVRLIIELRSRKIFSWKDIVEELNARTIPTRHGKTWMVTTVRNIHKCWSGKI